MIAYYTWLFDLLLRLKDKEADGLEAAGSIYVTGYKDELF